jgi:pyrimidine-nucleoside phosphorylase
MSKKIAAGAHAIVLDVKVGKGAFMPTLEKARELAEEMVAIGELSGRRVIAVLSPMDQPLGNAVGNALELREAIEMLHGVGPEDYRYHCLHLAAYMLILGQKAPDIETGLAMAERAMQDGSGLRKFRELVIAQHGDVSTIDNLDKLPKAKFIEPVLAEKSGWVNSVNAREVGETSVQLGAGREKKGDPIDPAVGIMVYTKIGDAIEAGQTLFEIHANNTGKLLQAKERLKNAIEITQDRVERPPYFHGVIGL